MRCKHALALTEKNLPVLDYFFEVQNPEYKVV